MPGSRSALSAVLALLAGLLLSVGVTACGGEKVSADEVTLPPPELAIPESADPTPGGDSTADSGNDSSTTDEDSGQSTTGEDDTAGSGSGAATATPAPGNTGGSAAPSQPTATPAPTQAPDSSANDTAPPAGSGAQKFEEFCEQNPGAC
jgi:hypothetical protein